MDVFSRILGNLLCVVRNNNPTSDEYYADPGTPTDSDFSRFSSQTPHSFRPSTIEPQSPQAVYVSGTPIAASISDGADSFVGFRGPFTTVAGYSVGTLPLPTRDLASNMCNFKNPALFLPAGQNAKAPSRCELSVPESELATRCQSTFSANFYTRLVKIGRLPSMDPSVPEDLLGPINVTRLSYCNAATGEETVLEESGETSSVITVPSSAYRGSVCVNALSAILITFEYSENGEIVGVSAEVMLTDVSISSPRAFVYQTYATKFKLSGGPSDARVVRERSGNPGYIAGKPLLAGTLVTSPDDENVVAVAQLESGFLLPGQDSTLGSIPAGQCTTSPQHLLPVAFGQNVYSSCVVQLTARSLQERCESNGVIEFLTIPANYVGAWGNADYLDVSQWVEVQEGSRPSAAAQTWIESTQTCHALITGINVEILYANFGSPRGPQAKILRARMQYVDSSWQFPATVGPSTSTTAKYLITSTVTFIKVPSQDVETYTPPAPPLFPQLPKDVLYPLYTGED